MAAARAAPPRVASWEWVTKLPLGFQCAADPGGSPAAAPMRAPRGESPRSPRWELRRLQIASPKMRKRNLAGLGCNNQSSRGPGGRAGRGLRCTSRGPEQPKFNCKYR